MELLRAVEVGNVHTLRQMLQSGVADVNFRDPQDGRTAIHVAARKGRLPEIRLMVEAYGANARLRDEHFQLPVHAAAAGGHTHVMSYFVQEGLASVGDWTMHWGLLHIAAFEGQPRAVKWLLDQGADPMSRGMHGRLPLHRAAYAGDRGGTACINLLLAAGIDVNAPDDSGWTALHASAEQGHVDATATLLDNGASLQEFDLSAGGDTPLMLAAGHGHHEVVELLLGSCENDSDCAAVVRTVNTRDQNVLHRAVETGNLRVVEALLCFPGAAEAGKAKDNAGRTPCEMAEEQRDELACLTLRQVPWGPSTHPDFPFNFKMAAKTVLMLGRSSQRTTGTSGRQQGTNSCGFWSLPPAVVQRILSLSAYPLSSWMWDSTLYFATDSPADIIAGNLEMCSLGSHPLPAEVAKDSRPPMERSALAQVMRAEVLGEHASPADIIWANTISSHSSTLISPPP